VEVEDDDAVETILEERFFHKPEMYYSPDKLVLSYGVPAPTPSFVYSALGKKPLPTREEIVADTVDSLAARFNLRYREQQWLAATAPVVRDVPPLPACPLTPPPPGSSSRRANSPCPPPASSASLATYVPWPSYLSATP